MSSLRKWLGRDANEWKRYTLVRRIGQVLENSYLKNTSSESSSMKRLFRSFVIVRFPANVLFCSVSCCTQVSGVLILKMLILDKFHSIRLMYSHILLLPANQRKKKQEIQLTAFPSSTFSVFELVSDISFSFKHFLCKSAKYLIRWACRYGSCLWGNLNAQQWKECVSQATRKFWSEKGEKNGRK